MIVEQNSVLHFYATFVDAVGEAAAISGTPTISVFHVQNAATQTDINAQNMTQLNATTYYYKWHPNRRAFKGSYAAKYFATYDDGSDVIGEEPFQIIERGHFGKSVGGLITKGKKDQTVWSMIEKDRVFALLEKMVNEMSAIEGIKGNIGKRIGELSKIDTKIEVGVKKQQDKLSEIIGSINKLHEKEPVVRKFDDSKIVFELNSLKKALEESKSLNEELRLPRIISELEDLRIGIEQFQEDLAKVLSTSSLQKGVGLNEEI